MFGRQALGAITCASCGAKVREDRVRCLRCGETLVAAATKAQPRISYRALATVAAVALAASVASIVGGSPEEVASAISTEIPIAAPPPVAPRQAVAAATPATSIVDPLAVAADSRRVGVANYNTGDLAQSLVAFTNAIEANPDDAEALNNLGQVLVRAGRPQEAIPYFDRAIAVTSEVWAYRFNRARAFGEMKQWSRAVAGYRDAARLFPEDYATQFNLAKALQANGDLQGAITAFQSAIRLAPGQPDFHLSLGLVQEAAQRPRDAAASYRAFLEMEPGSAEAAKVQARIGQLEGTSPAATVVPAATP